MLLGGSEGPLARYDSIVVGLGGAGSSAAYHLAANGQNVLGLEQFELLHANGSSHGKTRIYRTAYSEGPMYVPMVRRAQELWYLLQRESGTPIIQQTGGLFLGRPGSRLVSGARRTAETLSLPHEVYSADAVRDRFPQFQVRDDEAAVWDPAAGALFTENCIRSHCDGARNGGAELRFSEPVIRWSASSEGVEVRTARGEYRARSLVLTAGAWTGGLLRDLGLPLRIERQVVTWFPTAEGPLVRPGRMPVFLWDQGADREKYGLPDFGDGVKVGSWGGKGATSPETADRAFSESEAREAREFAEHSLRGVEPRVSAWTTCLYTLTPDRDFVIDRHPRHSNVVVVSACSGHGFKFTSVLGEVAARLAEGDAAGFDLTPFRATRFSSRSGQSDSATAN